MGLIAAAMEGTGAGLVGAGRQLGDYAEKSTLQSEAADIARMRDIALSDLHKGEMSYAEDLKRKPYADAAAEVEKARGGTVDADIMGTPRPRNEAEMRDVEKNAYKKRGLIDAAMQMEGHDITREEAGKGRDLSRELAKMTDERIREEANLTREQQLLLHNERTAEMKEQFKNQGLSIQQTDKGLAIVNVRDGSTSLLKDAEGNPIKAAKQEDSLAVMKAIGELSKSMETTNPEMAKQLGAIALSILSGKTGQDLGPKPTESDIAGLKQRAGNKAAVDFFEGKFGKGSAARYLDASKPATPSPAGGAPSAPGAAAPGDAMSAQQRREAEMRAEYDNQEKTRKQSAAEYQKEFQDNIERTRLRSEM